MLAAGRGQVNDVLKSLAAVFKPRLLKNSEGISANPFPDHFKAESFHFHSTPAHTRTETLRYVITAPGTLTGSARFQTTPQKPACNFNSSGDMQGIEFR